MDPKLKKRLEERREKGNLRKLRSYEGMIDLLSNDYLGLSRFSIKEAGYEGATGSRLISGNRNVIEESENKLARFFNYRSALCMNSGYDANLSVFSSIPQKGDVVLYDDAIHASVRDGIRLSLADSFSFKHNSTEDLERLLIKHREKTIYVAVESLYSMHGDLSPVKEISDICSKHKAFLIIDEAHSAGIFGNEGKGWSAENDVDDTVFIKLVTFGKAYGGHGAVVLCDEKVREYLINFARPFIYSTSLPIGEYQRMDQVVATAAKADSERRDLSDNILLFRSGIREELLRSDQRSPIQVIRFSDKNRLKVTESFLLDNNIACKAIYPPTVKEGQECLRVCIHSFNNSEEIRLITDSIH